MSKDIRVVAADGQHINGVVEIGEAESSWNFTPDTIWFDEEIYVVANTKLEDVAGNNFNDLLDQNMGSKISGDTDTTLAVRLESCS